MSLIFMFVAVSGPLFSAVTMKLTVLPDYNVLVWLSATLACFTYIVLSGIVTVVGYSVHVAVAWLVVVVPAIALVMLFL